jgi:hypothetical protein
LALAVDEEGEEGEKEDKDDENNESKLELGEGRGGFGGGGLRNEGGEAGLKVGYVGCRAVGRDAEARERSIVRLGAGGARGRRG